MTVLALAPPLGLSDETRSLARGVAVGPAAATNGALYLVFARWGKDPAIRAPALETIQHLNE